MCVNGLMIMLKGMQMPELKHKVLNSLKDVQNILHDSEVMLGNIFGGTKTVQLSAVYDQLIQAQQILDLIVEEDFWA